MSEIKTVDERLSGIDFSGNRVEVSTEEFAALNDEVSELRAAYEALQKELEETRNHQRPFHWRDQNDKLKAENAELKAEDEISAAVIEKCCNILAQIAITIKGEPKELTRHSYHDLPELVLVLHVENELNKNRILGQSDEIESQAKRIAELKNWANSLFYTRTKNDREIESLRKQVAELDEKLQYRTNTAC